MKSRNVRPHFPWKPLLIALVVLFLLQGLGLRGVAYSQATPPITQSGLNTKVSDPIITGSGLTQITQYNIRGRTRPGGACETNLCYSIGDINVPTNNIANLLNDAGLATSNIIGRVTGGNPSVVCGLIQAIGPGGF